MNAVFPAVPYCLDLIGAGRIETDPTVLKAFRPAK
jgi:molybdopterin adenylyltransferase